jgi:hypothetical protein
MPGKVYDDDKEPIETDKPETTPQSATEGRDEAGDKEMVTFSIRIPKAQKERLERYLWRNKGLAMSSFVRQLITEWMVKEKLW